MLQLENPFWTFSLDVYARPGVAEECLAFQTRYGTDVNVLLFCAWAGAVQRVALREPQVAALDAQVALWRQSIVLPLRSLRQGLKGMLELGQSVAALRKDVAAAELKAEQIEQAMLFGAAAAMVAGADVASAEEAVTANLISLLRHYDAAAVAPARLITASLAFAAAR